MGSQESGISDSEIMIMFAQSSVLSPLSSLSGTHRRRAVTVTELMVVILILCILGGGATLSYLRYYQKSLVLTQASKVQKTAGLARSRAIERGKPCQMAVWVAQPSLWVDDLETNGAVLHRKIVTPEPIHDLVQLVSVDKVTSPTADGMATIRFNPDGSSEDAWIYLKRAEAPDKDGEYCTVRIYGPTGFSKVFENERRKP
jgi:Tfp pilus assembly protein FimT